MDATIIGWLVGGVGVLLNLTVTTVLTILIKKWFANREKKEDQREADRQELEARREKEKLQKLQEQMDARCALQVRAIQDGDEKQLALIREQIGLLTQQIATITEQLGELKESGVSGLRDDILNSYWRCHDWQKFRTGWDTENMEDLYKSYKKLGGNSFIDHLMEEFYKIPLQ